MVGFRYSRSRTVEQVTYTFDDLADVSFSLPRTGVGNDGATWSGVVREGHVRLSNKAVDESDGATQTRIVTGEGQPELTAFGEDASVVSVSVDLRTCTYTLSASFSVLATMDEATGPMKVGALTTRRLALSSCPTGRAAGALGAVGAHDPGQRGLLSPAGRSSRICSSPGTATTWRGRGPRA
jgi:hypothetical protein